MSKIICVGVAVRGRSRLLRAGLLASTALVGLGGLLASGGARAQTYTVTSASGDSSGTVAGTLSWAIAQVNANTATTSSIPQVITLQFGLGAIALSGPLSPILNSVTILGNNDTISGANATRVFFIGVDNATMTSPQGASASTTSIVAQRQQVTINNVTLASGLAQGGAGSGSGGGGLGAGGAVFVNQRAPM